MSEQRRGPHIVKIVTSNLIVFVLIMALIEFVSSRFVSLSTVNLVDSPRYNHTWKPNSAYEHTEWIALNPDFPEPYTHQYNAQGWIETYDIQPEKPANTFRIFYVGDSFVEGTAPMDQSLPSLVEQGLNELALESEWTFEVINTGTASYSPLIYYVLIDHLVQAYDPDLIVVNVDMTDNFDDWKYRQTAVYDEAGNPVAVPPRDVSEDEFVDTNEGAIRTSLILRLQLFLFENSYFYNLMLRAMVSFRPDMRPSDPEPGQTPSNQSANVLVQRWAWCAEEWDNETQENVDAMFDILNRLAQLTTEAGVGFMLTAVPHYPQFPNSIPQGGSNCFSPRPHRALANLAADLEIPYLNSYEQLRSTVEGTPQEKYYYINDMHFNPRGYALWAQAHLHFLTAIDNQLLPDTILRRP